MTTNTSQAQCEDCLQMLCCLHLKDQCQELSQQLDRIQNMGGVFRDTLNEKKTGLHGHVLIKRIDQWETNSIELIQRKAKECRERIVQHASEHFSQMEDHLSKFADLIKEARQEGVLHEHNLIPLKQKVIQLKSDLEQISNISIQQGPTSFINGISVVIPSEQVVPASSSPIDSKTRWKQNGLTVAGGNGKGEKSNQLSCPFGVCVDDNMQCIYIADGLNHRIVEWKYDGKCGRTVVGELSLMLHIMNQPTDIVVHKKTGSLVVSDWGNKRVVLLSRRNFPNIVPIISDVDCWGLAIDKSGDIYVSDCVKHEVRRWATGDKKGTIVAGGYGKGNHLIQLNFPTHLFVDEEYSLYVSDNHNHRVMKWVKGATEGIVVAGGQGQGHSLTQLSYPQGVGVDHLGNVYVADSGNYRVMRWSKESAEGQIILGGNGKGHEPNQFSGVDGLSFDQQGNIYAVDWDNHRVQKFEIALS